MTAPRTPEQYAADQLTIAAAAIRAAGSILDGAGRMDVIPAWCVRAMGTALANIDATIVQLLRPDDPAEPAAATKMHIWQDQVTP